MVKPFTERIHTGYATMPTMLHFRRSASYNLAQNTSKPAGDSRQAATSKKAKLIRDFGSFSRSSVSSSSTTEEDHEGVCIITLSSSGCKVPANLNRKRPKKNKRKGPAPQLVQLSHAAMKPAQVLRPPVSYGQCQHAVQTDRLVSPQRQRSRSRTRSAKSSKKKSKRVIGLPRGLFHCAGGAARSRSCTPERNIGLRVNLTGGDKENVNLGDKVQHAWDEQTNSQRSGQVEINQIYQPASVGRLSRRDRYHRQGGGASSGISSAPPDLCSLSLTRCQGQQADKDNTVNHMGVHVKLRKKSSGSKAKSVATIQARPLPAIPPPPKESQVKLVKVLNLSGFMKNKWISGLSVTKKNEIVIVDLREAHMLDEHGNHKKTLGLKDKVRLMEPIDVTVMNNGNILISDHADQQVKVYNWKGQYLRSVRSQCLTNIAGVATNDKKEIFIAGTDRQCVSVVTEEDTFVTSIPAEAGGTKSHFEHPYSIAINPLTGAIIVGDDYRQLVVAVSKEGKILWRFCPNGDRLFFPSSICVDNEGYVFIADLYNEKVYMLDSGGKFLKTLLSRGDGLKGGPGAIATDGRGHLLVADEEKTVKVFRYGEDGFTLYRRFSQCPAVA